MQLTAGRYRLVPARSRVRVLAHAPGHDFRAEGARLEGNLELAPDGALQGDLSFPLDALAAGDALGTHELRKFLGLESPSTPRDARIARGHLRGSFPRSGDRGEAAVELSIGARRATVSARLSRALGTAGAAGEAATATAGAPPPVSGSARFELTFGALGFTPPKLLFLRVKETLELEVDVVLELAP